MNKIKQIKLKNFKFFYSEVTLDFERKNVLLYGENGSGKSCLYWALYTFFQSVFKKDNKHIHKYFDPRHDENLRNRFAADEEESYIKVVFEDGLESLTEKTISNTTVNTKTGNLIKQVTQGSELINYKLLSNIHDFKNSHQIDLFPVINKDVLMFINFREQFIKQDGTVGTTNAQDWWDYIEPGMQPRTNMHQQPYKNFTIAVAKFNTEMEFYLNSIIESVNEYLAKLNQSFKVDFSFKPCTYDDFVEGSTTKRNRVTIPPEIILSLEFNHSELDEIKRKVSRPHTFLNEARLTAIALAIRFAMLDQKIVSDDTPKVLVLDDILISLDMSNRDKVLDIVLKEFDDYQLLIFTHDKYFFELLRHRIKRLNDEEWIYKELYSHEKDGIPQPFIKNSNTYLEKAEFYFYQKEYEIAGNFLRKEAEAFCKDFLPKKLHYTKDYNLHNLDGLITECKKFAENSGLDKNLFDDLDSHRKFVLNPASHDSYNVPKFNSEIKNCLHTLKELRKIKNEPFLKRGEIIEFELTTADGRDTFKFEIILEDDFRLLKEPNSESVISKGMVNYWVYKNNNKTTTNELQHSNISIQSFYNKNYGNSDKTKNADFWEEMVFSQTGKQLKTKRKY